MRERVARRVDALPTDDVLRLATERLIEIVGEAASQLSPELRNAHPHVDRTGPRGLGVVLTHRYVGIDVGVIQDLVRRELPAQIGSILEELE